MKKFLFLILSLMIFGSAAQAYECDEMVLNSIKNNQIVDFNIKTGKWSRNLGLNDYVFTKHVMLGTGGYSEYTFKDKAFDMDTTYEFLYYSRLMGFSAHNLKFYEFTYNGDDFERRELTKEEVQYLFPDVQILLVSEFVDNSITVEVPVFHKKAYMILNDTDMEFFKYKFKFYKPKTRLFKNIFEVNAPRVMLYSHIKRHDDMYPTLRVIVKPLFKYEQPTLDSAPEGEVSEPEDTENNESNNEPAPAPYEFNFTI